MAFELPQNGVVALRETETLHQPLRRPSTGRMTDQMNEFAHPAGSPGKKGGRSADVDGCLNPPEFGDMGSAAATGID